MHQPEEDKDHKEQDQLLFTSSIDLPHYAFRGEELLKLLLSKEEGGSDHFLPSELDPMNHQTLFSGLNP
ncbi:hypothetical protein PROFUN_03133 [Planoprotostelium fungivorum]|uniref:Uncharacterized protein n=1 Tax=Planoprotostelium fungivorum TaxID=1890364 RepID=A0A2P6NQB3_9EUKA|nr:hypothetical protein PROFUN_03133 [Planoprotostelium fungivorum]